MDLHLGHVSLEMLNNFTAVLHDQPEQHFDKCECVSINGHNCSRRPGLLVSNCLSFSYSIVAAFKPDS